MRLSLRVITTGGEIEGPSSMNTFAQAWKLMEGILRPEGFAELQVEDPGGNGLGLHSLKVGGRYCHDGSW